MGAYEDVMSAAAPLFDKLQEIILAHKEPYIAEGSIWFVGGGDITKSSAFENKRRNIFNLASGAQNIMEVGFNAGHSTAIMLLASPDSKVTIFDLGEHPYTVPALEYLGQVFPGRIQAAYLGDSRHTLPYFVENVVEKECFGGFDLLHIDGGHTEDILASDFAWCRRMAAVDHTVVIDDDDWPVIHKFNRRMVAEERLIGPLIEEGGHFVGTYKSLIPIGKVGGAQDGVTLVVCRWKRDLAWLEGVSRVGRQVYIHDKGGDPLIGLRDGDIVLQVPNIGMDQYSNLRYIVDNYDSLPGVVIFCQDDLDGHTDGYNSLKFESTEGLLEYMIREVRHHGHTLNAYTWSDRFGPGILPSKDLKFMLGPELVETNIPETFGEWFTRYVRPGWEGWDRMVWFKNAIFGASREVIRSRPKEEYEAILRQFCMPKSELDHFVERAWYYILNLDRPRNKST